MWLAETLAMRGIRPAIISRGYGREGDGARIVDPNGSWRIFGDEPSMMARKLEKVPVVVSENRRLAGLKLLQHTEVDLFILDDGFQHHALKRDLDIVAIDNHRRFGTGWLMPAGILREPVKRLRDADFIVVTKASEPDTEFGKYLSGLFSGPVLWADYRPVSLLPVKDASPDGDGVHPEGPFTAFCGIADPEGFRISLDRLGFNIQDLIVFPDHHPYTEMDMTRILETARRTGAGALVTTEKDAVRLPGYDGDIPCYIHSMEAVLPESASLLIEQVTALVHGDKGSI
jgi:tetraacyldisaccharide 4'-kinase